VNRVGGRNFAASWIIFSKKREKENVPWRHKGLSLVIGNEMSSERGREREKRGECDGKIKWEGRENVKNPPLDQHHIFGKLKNEMKFIVLGLNKIEMKAINELKEKL
jgi:hypothetical protein